MNLSNFETLTAAQAHTEFSQRMITNKSTAIYLDAVGLYLVIHEIAKGESDTEAVDANGDPTGAVNPHPAKATCLLITNTLADSSSDGNDFNFMQGTTKGDGVIAKTQELRDVTLTDYTAQIDDFLTICINHCNITTYPFFKATQAEFDEAKSVEALKGERVAHSYTVGGFPTNEPTAFIIKTRELIVDVIFDEIVPVDCVVSIQTLLLDTVTGVYVPEAVTNAVRVSKDSQGKSYRISRNYSARKLKFIATCSHGLPFQVRVAEA